MLAVVAEPSETSMHRRVLVLLATIVACAALVPAGQTATAGPSPFPPSAHTEKSRIVNLGHHDRVLLTPVGRTGRTLVSPLPGRTPGLYLTSTDTGTTVQSATGGTPTVVAGAAPSAAVDDPGDLVELHFAAIARDGRDAVAHINVMDLNGGTVFTRELPADPGSTCTTASFAASSCLLVPTGDYSVMGFVTTMPAAQPSTVSSRTIENVSLVGEPQVHITASRDFVLDARVAKQLTVATPGRATKVNAEGAMQVGYQRTAANGQTLSAAVRPAFMLDNHFYLQPTAAVSLGAFNTLTRLRLEEPDIRMAAPGVGPLHPEYYDAVWFSDVASDFPMYDGHARLPVVDVGHATEQDLAGRHLHGAIAVAERSDDVSVADQSNAAADAGAAFVVIYNDGPGDNGDPNGTGVKLRVPTVRLDHAEGLALTGLPRGARVDLRGEPASPYLYDLAIKDQGRIPANLHYTYRRDQLATQVRELHGQPTIGSTFSEAAYQFQPGDTFAISTMFPFRGGARARTEYRIPDPDTRWTYAITSPESSYNALFPEPPVQEMLLSDPHRTAYAAGEHDTLPIATAPITAAPNPGTPVQRAGDRMRVNIDGFTDAEGNHGSAFSDASGMSTHLEIRADGALIAETDHLPYGTVTLPSGGAQIAIAFRSDNPQPWNQLSTHTDTTWSFPSTTTPAGQIVTEPLILPDYDVPVDLHNQVRPGDTGLVEFDVVLRHQTGAADAPIDDVTLDASYDDGQTWAPTTVTRTATGWHVELPPGTGFVSLRLHAADAGGSAIDQTIVRAFYVR